MFFVCVFAQLVATVRGRKLHSRCSNCEKFINFIIHYSKQAHIINPLFHEFYFTSVFKI